MYTQEASGKADALIHRILEVCESEGASTLEVKLASARLQRIVSERIDEIEAGQLFTAYPLTEN